MCKTFVMIYRQTLPVDVSRISSGVLRHHPHTFQRRPGDCQSSKREAKYKRLQKAVASSAPPAIVLSLLVVEKYGKGDCSGQSLFASRVFRNA
jgi:RNA:NAD 2'-phosphotransferase (TPT1/KptA family)